MRPDWYRKLARMNNTNPVAKPPNMPINPVHTAQVITDTASNGTLRFNLSDRVPSIGPVSATSNMEPDNARVKWVSVPPMSSVTHRGK